MFILKNNISSVIKKERAKERKECERKALNELRQTVSDLKKSYEDRLKEQKKDFLKNIKDLGKEIAALKSEIEKKHKDYQTLRLREKQIDDLSAEFEDILEDFGIKVQEAIQPFYRTRSKIDGVKRKSDRLHEKSDKTFRSVEKKQ